MKVNHSFKRFSQRIGIKIIRFFASTDHDGNHSKFESESFQICKALISDKDTVLIMSPVSGKRYIESKSKNLFVTIETTKLTITNHSYSYDVEIQGKAYSRIQRLFDAELNSRCIDYENNISSNIKHSLTTIYKSLTNEHV
jgi:hypothetical protein